MPVDSPSLKLDPYQSQVPTVQIPPQDLQPGGPLPTQAGYMGKVGSGFAVGDNIFKGFMRGHELLAQKKSQAANYAVDLSQKNEQSAWQTYQDSLRTGQAKPGDEKDPAYQAYLQAHHATSQTMEKVAIPDEKPKGQKGAKKKADDDNKPKSFGEKLQDFMQANPHIIPQLAITARQPNKPVMSAETQKTQQELASGANQLTLQGQTIDSNSRKQKEDTENQQRATAERTVEEAGGVDKVLSDPKAAPEVKQAASRIKFTAIDKESPEGKIKTGLEQKVLSGQAMTPGEHQLAGYLGITPEPKQVKITGKNGHEQEILVDPTTNQPIAGSKPLDLGPPQWAQEFYGERAAKKRDLQQAVAKDPEQYGITLTGDKKTDSARIDATAMRLFTDHEEGIKSAAGATSKTAYETSRDNDILSDVAKQLKTMIPPDKAGNVGKANFDWPGEKKPVMLSHEDAQRILGQFVTDRDGEHPGVYTFRSKPQLQSGKDAGAAERDRQWAYSLVKDRMMAQKGKKAMTAQQADAVLKNTALGQPITPDEVQAPPTSPSAGKGVLRRFWDAGPFGSGEDAKPKGGLTPPPTSGATPGGKYYTVPGIDGPVQLSDEDLAKAKAANIPLEEVSPDLIKQFQQ